jgi:DNA-binding CsgD family transcriptional regulator
MVDDSDKPALRLSPAFERYAELYPSVRPRITALLASHDPAVRRKAGALLGAQQRREAARRARLIGAYKLTPAEARVAIHIIDGGDIAGYARDFGVSPGTARSQLKSVFAKTGVSRQSALVKLGMA